MSKDKNNIFEAIVLFLFGTIVKSFLNDSLAKCSVIVGGIFLPFGV